MHPILLPYKYEKDRKATKLTSLAGLSLYLDFMRGLGFDHALREHLNSRNGRAFPHANPFECNLVSEQFQLNRRSFRSSEVWIVIKIVRAKYEAWKAFKPHVARYLCGKVIFGCAGAERRFAKGAFDA